jgi:hypothetical protein
LGGFYKTTIYSNDEVDHQEIHIGQFKYRGNGKEKKQRPDDVILDADSEPRVGEGALAIGLHYQSSD